jgi:hypothetical protein
MKCRCGVASSVVLHSVMVASRWCMCSELGSKSNHEALVVTVDCVRVGLQLRHWTKAVGCSSNVGVDASGDLEFS